MQVRLGTLLGVAVVASTALSAGPAVSTAAAGSSSDRAGASAPPGASAARAVPIRSLAVARLGRGPEARIDHLQDGVLKTASGARIVVSTPGKVAAQRLEGPDGNGGWIVLARRGDKGWNWLVRPDAEPVKFPGLRFYWDAESWFTPRVSRDGNWLMMTWADRGGYGLQAYDVAKEDWAYFGSRTEIGAKFDPPRRFHLYEVLDAGGGHLIARGTMGRTNAEAVADVTAADGETSATFRVLGGEANAAFIDQDLVFVAAGKGPQTFGPTSISTPGVPAWSAPFSALSVSPSGTYALGTVTIRGKSSPAVLELRRMDTGKLVKRFRYSRAITRKNHGLTSKHEQTARFENDDEFVFELAGAKGRALVRCRVAMPQCERASDLGGILTTSYEKIDFGPNW